MIEKHLIAVIDDENDLREDYCRLLTEDFKVIDFSSGASFLQYLSSHKGPTPDLVITDYKMPQMDGLEMLKSARDQGLACPFIVLSGDIEQAPVPTAISLIPHRLLEKPTNFEHLRQTAFELLNE